MPESANVRSLDALQEFRAALIEFIDMAKRAVSTGESEVNHIQTWVGHTQLMHWRHQIRRGEEKLAQAKSELFRATISQPDNPRGPTDQIRLVRRRKEEIAFAKRKLLTTQHWSRVIEHENHEYRSAMSPLTASLDGELKKAVVKIDNAITTIELYLADIVQTSEDTTVPIEAESIARSGSDRKDLDDEHGDSQSPTDESD